MPPAGGGKTPVPEYQELAEIPGEPFGHPVRTIDPACLGKPFEEEDVIDQAVDLVRDIPRMERGAVHSALYPFSAGNIIAGNKVHIHIIDHGIDVGMFRVFFMETVRKRCCNAPGKRKALLFKCLPGKRGSNRRKTSRSGLPVIQVWRAMEPTTMPCALPLRRSPQEGAPQYRRMVFLLLCTGGGSQAPASSWGSRVTISPPAGPRRQGPAG